jgi:hypothetical protein
MLLVEIVVLVLMMRSAGGVMVNILKVVELMMEVV